MAGVKHQERPEVGRNVNVRSDTYGQNSSKRSCTTFYAGMVCVCVWPCPIFEKEKAIVNARPEALRFIPEGALECMCSAG
jgi:hypothetical protein